MVSLPTGDDDAGGLGLVDAQPVSQKAMLPNGKVTGTTPITEMTPFRLVVPGVDIKKKAGAVIFPAQVKAAEEAFRKEQQEHKAGMRALPPTPPTWGTAATARRREMRSKAAGKRRAADTEEGEMSDGASSTASKLARGVRGMRARDDEEGDLR